MTHLLQYNYFHRNKHTCAYSTQRTFIYTINIIIYYLFIRKVYVLSVFYNTTDKMMDHKPYVINRCDQYLKLLEFNILSKHLTCV